MTALDDKLASRAGGARPDGRDGPHHPAPEPSPLPASLRTRRCETHGHIDLSVWTEHMRALDVGDRCPVPTYQEEPCGMPLGPEREWGAASVPGARVREAPLDQIRVESVAYERSAGPPDLRTPVRATHEPTGISVICDENRSQLANKDEAIRRVRVLVAEQAPLPASVQDTPAPSSPKGNSLDHLRSLRAGWDSYGGKPTADAALRTAESAAWVPVPDGGVQWELRAGGRDIEVEIGPDGSVVDVSVEPSPAGDGEGDALRIVRGVIQRARDARSDGRARNELQAARWDGFVAALDHLDLEVGRAFGESHLQSAERVADLLDPAGGEVQDTPAREEFRVVNKHGHVLQHADDLANAFDRRGWFGAPGIRVQRRLAATEWVDVPASTEGRTDGDAG